MSLNPDQLKAVHTLRGPMLVLAGAGSGKTRVVTFRIRELILNGTRADRILAVTFTNKAAREMLQRTTELLKLRRGAPRPEVSTLHSLCVRILRRHAERLGYPRQFSICDRGDQETFARAALRNIRVDDQKLKPNDFLSLVGGWKSKGLNDRAALESADGDRQTLAALAYEKYQAALAAQGTMDFDDLLLQTERLLREFPDVCAQEAARFDQVMIDEYQDTNASQYRIIRALTLRHRNLCVVGDDDQSIYGWRGAEVQHILNFTKDWPDALVIRLEMNYRSREPILALANTLIANNGTRHGKVLQAFRKGGAAPRFLRFEDETAEAEAVVREIAQKVNREDEDRIPLHHFAILFRTNEQPRAFELELRRNKVRYTLVGGQSFFDRKEVRDILAYLKLLAHPGDEVSLLRVINTPSRGIGTNSIKALMEVAVQAGKPLGEILPRAVEEAELAPAICERINGFVRLIEKYRTRMATETLSQAARALVDEIDYKGELERLYKTPAEVEARMLTVDGVLKSIEEYEARTDEPTLSGFLEDTALAGRDDFGDDKEKQSGVNLMTLHSAKGLEFPHVYMVGMEEGLMPHRRVIAEGNGVEEERRLCYVGVTRAEDTLTLSLCKARNKWGKLRPSIPSRFLLEMRGENEKAARAAEASQAEMQRELAAEAAAEKAAAEAAAKKKKRTASSKVPASSKASPPSAPRVTATGVRATTALATARPSAPSTARVPTPAPSSQPAVVRRSAAPASSTPGTTSASAKRSLDSAVPPSSVSGTVSASVKPPWESAVPSSSVPGTASSSAERSQGFALPAARPAASVSNPTVAATAVPPPRAATAAGGAAPARPRATTAATRTAAPTASARPSGVVLRPKLQGATQTLGAGSRPALTGAAARPAAVSGAASALAAGASTTAGSAGGGSSSGLSPSEKRPLTAGSGVAPSGRGATPGKPVPVGPPSGLGLGKQAPTPVGPASGLGPLQGKEAAAPAGPPSGLGPLLGKQAPAPVGPPSGLGPLLGKQGSTPVGPPSGLGPLLGKQAATPVGPPSGLGPLLGKQAPTPVGPPSGLGPLLGARPATAPDRSGPPHEKRAGAPISGARPLPAAPAAWPSPPASIGHAEKPE